MNHTLRILAVAIAATAIVGCKGRQTRGDDPASAPSTPPTAQTQPAATNPWTDPNSLNNMPCLKARTVNFDFDRAEVKAEFDEILGCHAKWLASNPGARLTLEGNADERGTREYNLGLGERRGNSVRDVLLTRGGSSSQLTVVSFGEEKPLCSESTEECWWRNRRVDLVYTKQQ